jgi:O-antigen ligase
MFTLSAKTRFSKWILLSGLSLFLISTVYIPETYSRNFFDSNAFPHFFFLVLSAFLFLVIICLKDGTRKLSRAELSSLFLLILVSAVSTIRSSDPIGSLIGDTQRFTGSISLIALIIVLIFHSNIQISHAHKLIFLVLITVGFVGVLAVGQYYQLISIPGAPGIGSTLGNIDFLAAWTGTTFPLVFVLAKREARVRNIVLAVFVLFSIYVLSIDGAKQGLIDLFIGGLAVIVYPLRKRILDFLPTPVSKIIAVSIAATVWLELVLLLPFQKGKIFGISGDYNVKIRTEYWISAIKTFSHNILFGVGPDNYGNYYQQYRTINSVRMEDQVISNDAHSGLFQTLATLGIFGAISFGILFYLIIKALWKAYRNFPEYRKTLYFIGVFFLTFATNTLISPITLPNKYIFWALGGIILGTKLQNSKVSNKVLDEHAKSDEVALPQTSILDRISQSIVKKILLSVLILIIALSLALVGQLAKAEFSLIGPINDLGKTPITQRTLNYKFHSILPCTYYYKVQELFALKNSSEKAFDFAKQEVATNPRCLEARITLFRYYALNKQNRLATEQLLKIMKLAPANREVLGILHDVATSWGDITLKSYLEDQERKLGFIK